MLLKCAALQNSGKPVVEIAHVAKDRGQRSIYVASDLLADEEAVAAASAERREPVIERDARHPQPPRTARARGREVRSDREPLQVRVKIRKNGEEVDGKSILGLLLLAASQGTRITIAVYGEDEAAAFAAVEDLIARSFDEDQ